MIVAYWSPYKGHGKVTATMVANAVMLSSEYISKTLLVDLHCTGDALRYLVDMSKIGLKPDTHQGFGAVRRFVESGKLDPVSINSAVTNIITEKLYVLRTDPYEKDNPYHILENVVKAVDSIYDIVFVDAGSGDDHELSKKVIASADLVVVCLPQHKVVDSQLTNKITAMVHNRPVIYNLTAFDEASSVSTTKVTKALGVNKKVVGTTPYNVEFSDSCVKSNSIEFIWKLPRVTKSLFKHTEDEIFGEKVRVFTNLILSTLDLALDKEGR